MRIMFKGKFKVSFWVPTRTNENKKQQQQTKNTKNWNSNFIVVTAATNQQ